MKGGKITSDLKRTNMSCWKKHMELSNALFSSSFTLAAYTVEILENSTSLCRIFACIHGSVNERPQTGTL